MIQEKFKKNPIKVDMRFKKAAIIFACIVAVSLFVPFIASRGQVVITIAAIGRFMSEGQTAGLILIVAIIASITSCITLVAVKTQNILAFISIALGIIGTISAFVSLFTIKTASDAVGYLNSEFMVFFNLNFGWYLLFIGSFGVMFCSFRAIKVKTGYIILAVLCAIWLIPILWLFANSFRATPGLFSPTFFPRNWTIRNYMTLFTDSGEGNMFNFGRWFFNTMIVATATMFVSATIILSTSYAISRTKFRGKPFLMAGLLIVGMFPGFMAMTAVYFMLQWIGLGQTLIALIAVYSGSSALGFLIVKGFFDTLPQSIEEAAAIDGASKLRVFIQIMIPLSKPIIIFTLLTSFMGPWGDFIFASFLLRGQRDNFTVAVGLHQMLGDRWIESWYTRFAAGSILISIPIAGLFVALQKYYTQGVSGAVKG
ncbi:MAG: ABC transporter permease subunit [Firmicutes bacterium]|nr:ABC transporter permease subunit [Bacillota bacterium]